MIKTCYVCKKEFDAHPGNKKLCDDCRKRIIRTINNPKKGECTVCKKKFNPQRSNQRYCSKKCSRISDQVMSNYRHEIEKEKHAMKNKENAIMNHKSIDEMERIARRHGMDYGTYTALLRMNGKQ